MLYIVSDAQAVSSGLLPKDLIGNQESSVVLIEDAVTIKEFPGEAVYVLAEDAAVRKVTPVFPKVSYADMVKLIFEADRVVAL